MRITGERLSRRVHDTTATTVTLVLLSAQPGEDLATIADMETCLAAAFFTEAH